MGDSFYVNGGDSGVLRYSPVLYQQLSDEAQEEGSGYVQYLRDGKSSHREDVSGGNAYHGVCEHRRGNCRGNLVRQGDVAAAS